MFQRLTSDRSARDVTPARYNGRMVQLDDGSRIGYRPTSESGLPAIDINIPGYRGVTKLHFTE